MKTDYIMEHIKMLCNVTSGEQKKILPASIRLRQTNRMRVYPRGVE